VHLLADDGLPLQPDLVVLFFCINDMVDVIYFQPDKIAGKGLRFPEPRIPHASGLVRATATLYTQMRERRIRERLAWAMTEPFEGPDEALRGWDDLFREPLPGPVADAWRLSKEHLDRFHAQCRERDIPMVLVLTSTVWQLAEGDRYLQPTRTLSAWALARDVPFLDLTGVYRKRCSELDLDPRKMVPDTVHPTPRANRFAIDALTELLDSAGLLPGD
jgi:hypothetical protein